MPVVRKQVHPRDSHRVLRITLVCIITHLLVNLHQIHAWFQVFPIESMPYLVNGKIDRQTLLRRYSEISGKILSRLIKYGSWRGLFRGITIITIHRQTEKTFRRRKDSLNLVP